MYHFEEKRNYILVSVSGNVYFKDLTEAIVKLLSMEKYPHKDDIWLYEDCNYLLSHSEVLHLVDIILKYYPSSATRKKTAIVAESGFIRAIAIIWADYAKQLPYSPGIFTSINEAELWLEE